MPTYKISQLSAVTSLTGTEELEVNQSGTSRKATRSQVLGVGSVTQAYSANLDAFAGKTAPSGTVVGTSDTQTLTNKTLTSPSATNAFLTTAREKVTVTATAATGTINYDALTQAILYYTTNSSANFTVNIRGDGSTTLNSMMATGDSLTLVFLVTNGSTARYQTGFQIDGSSVTPKWLNGFAPTAGNANSIDSYTYTIIKTASATYTVFAQQTKFA